MGSRGVGRKVRFFKLLKRDCIKTFDKTSGSKRVAFVYDGTVYGGVEVYLLALLRHLDYSRYNPAVVIPGYNYPFRPKGFQEQVQALGVPLLTPPHPGKSRNISFVKDVINMCQLFRQTETQVVHIQTSRFDGGRRAILAARLAGVPAVIRTEHIAPSVNMTFYSKYTTKPFDWLTNYIVTDSNSNRTEQIKLLNRAPRKVICYHCGIELERFDSVHDTSAAKLRLGFDPALPVVGAVGRLVEQKGHTYLVSAAARVIKEFGPVNFVLVGDGLLEEQLKAQVAELNIAQYFHFMGFQSKHIPYVEAMDVTVMSSVFEGFSLSMLEFMAMGKPTVVTDYPSFLEAVTDGESGVVVAMRDGEAMAEGILKLLRNPTFAHKMGQAALARVQQEFSIQRLANDTMNLYDTILGINSNWH